MDKVNKFLEIFSDRQNVAMLAKASKKARIVASRTIAKNIGTMAVNGTLFSTLKAASFPTERGGSVEFRLKPDSVWERFGGSQFGEDSREGRVSFAKDVLRLVGQQCSLALRSYIRAHKEAHPDWESPAFDFADASDQRLALEVFSQVFEFGSKVHNPAPVRRPTEMISAADVIAKQLLEQFG